MSRSLLVLFIGLIFLSGAHAAQAQSGSRPREVAVSPDGQTVLVTSWASHSISVRVNGQQQYLDVGGRSWGVAFLDDLRAVVTCPEEDFIVRLQRPTATSSFTRTKVHGVDGSLVGCTTVIAGAAPGTAFVANRGQAPQGAASWQHSVIAFDFDTGAGPTRFVTEREPRALALSPDGERLYVGTVQGALGGDGLATPHPMWPAHYDGGSVVSYDTSSLLALQRFSIGSPVRGLAIWKNHSPTAKTAYRLFISHVGNGAQGEDPEFGGRLIPNVVTSTGFKSDHTAGAPQHFVHDHDPDHEDATDGPAMVVPEAMVVRPSGGINDPAELWVTHSASGTVSRARLDLFTGAILTSGSFDLEAFANLDGHTYFQTVTGHDGQEPQMSSAWSEPGIIRSFGVVDSPDVFYTAGGSPPRSSNPRGIAYDAVHDEVLVTSQFENRLSAFDTGANAQLSWSVSLGTGTVSETERNFFTFGEGFDFREVTMVVDPAPRVNNLSCGTCHVDGHIDGKVRITKRDIQNLNDQSQRDEPVAVPSIFDVGQTEWLFFEGLKTVMDTIEGGSCIYCDFESASPIDPNVIVAGNGFFLDTVEFTNGLLSPPSPYAPDGELSEAAKRGRGWFDAMNCNRCHSTTTPVFPRTMENISRPDGPLPMSLSTNNPFLHDATQSFISTVADGQSQRNLTDVGSRVDETNVRRRGINTPSLAGAWDNAPYMHDGRHATLDDVLANTWLNVADEHRAAPVWAMASAPDNAFNNLDLSDPDLPQLQPGMKLFKFKTHSSTDPNLDGTGSWVSVANYLSSSEKQDLESYLRSLSSQTDPCGPKTLTMSQPAAFFIPGCTEVMLHWTTNLPVACRVEITRENGTDEVIHLPVGTDHSVTTDYNLRSHDQVTVFATWCDESVERTQAYFLKKCLFGGGAPSMAKASGIERISPNPFNPRTEIHLVLNRAQPVQMRIFDLRGRLVRSLQDGTLSAGSHVLKWEGRDDSGASVASGVYFLTLRTQDVNEKRKLVLIE